MDSRWPNRSHKGVLQIRSTFTLSYYPEMQFKNTKAMALFGTKHTCQTVHARSQRLRHANWKRELVWLTLTSGGKVPATCSSRREEGGATGESVCWMTCSGWREPVALKWERCWLLRRDCWQTDYLFIVALGGTHATGLQWTTGVPRWIMCLALYIHY